VINKVYLNFDALKKLFLFLNLMSISLNNCVIRSSDLCNLVCSLSGDLPLDLAFLLADGVLHSTLVLKFVDDTSVLPADFGGEAAEVAVLWGEKLMS